MLGVLEEEFFSWKGCVFQRFLEVEKDAFALMVFASLSYHHGMTKKNTSVLYRGMAVPGNGSERRKSRSVYDYKFKWLASVVEVKHK